MEPIVYQITNLLQPQFGQKKNCFELVSILSRRVVPILILVLEHFSKFGFFRAKVKLGLILQLFSGCFQQNANQHNNSV